MIRREFITLLGGVRIPATSVERVEFVLVMSKLANLEADIAGHAMLRFVFTEDCRPLVLGDNEDPSALEDYGAMVQDFVHVFKGPKAPVGEVYNAIEVPKGEIMPIFPDGKPF